MSKYVPQIIWYHRKHTGAHGLYASNCAILALAVNNFPFATEEIVICVTVRSPETYEVSGELIVTLITIWWWQKLGKDWQ